MLRASVIALMLMIAPVHAQEVPDIDDALAELMNGDGDPVDIGETGTPNSHGDPITHDDPDWIIEHGMPGSDDVYGDDEWEDGPREPWSCATADMERECNPVFDNPDYEPDPNRSDYSAYVEWNNGSEDDEPV